MLSEQAAMVPSLLHRNAALEERLRLLRNGKKSDTSNTPPSHWLGRSNSKNLREQSGRKTGGRSGHKGHTLAISLTPDETDDHVPEYCGDRGTGLH